MVEDGSRDDMMMDYQPGPGHHHHQLHPPGPPPPPYAHAPQQHNRAGPPGGAWPHGSRDPVQTIRSPSMPEVDPGGGGGGSGGPPPPHASYPPPPHHPPYEEQPGGRHTAMASSSMEFHHQQQRGASVPPPTAAAVSPNARARAPPQPHPQGSPLRQRPAAHAVCCCVLEFCLRVWMRAVVVGHADCEIVASPRQMRADVCIRAHACSIEWRHHPRARYNNLARVPAADRLTSVKYCSACLPRPSSDSWHTRTTVPRARTRAQTLTQQRTTCTPPRARRGKIPRRSSITLRVGG